MAREELLESEHWCIFRLLLSTVSDAELDEVEQQLNSERVARRERENSIVRLFYSAMAARDLDTAEEQIRQERKGRAEDQRLARESESAGPSRTPAARRKVRRGATRSR